MMNFKPGDQVRLTTGSPPMTVHEVDAVAGTVSCIWFDPEQGIQRETFPVFMLELVIRPLTDSSTSQPT